MLVSLRLHGGPDHGKTVRVNMPFPGEVYRVAVAPKPRDWTKKSENPFLPSYKVVSYRPVTDTSGNLMRDDSGYFIYEP